MTKMKKISEAEWRVCQTLWRQSPLTANEIVAQMADSVSWSPRTVKTLLGRLVKKSVLGYENVGREYHYFPKISEAECVTAYTRSFVERVFGGAAGAMVAAFIKDQRLSDEEIAELKAILEQKSAHS
jgi:BlaI family penicillinase repressor